MSPLLDGLAGLLAGVLTGFGLGGGGPLMIYMAAAGLPQRAAQGMNLLYFLPTAAAALVGHVRARLVNWRLVWPAAGAGLVTSLGAVWLAQSLGDELLRKLFGGLLLCMGLRELFSK